jgi:hypothetical protein
MSPSVAKQVGDFVMKYKENSLFLLHFADLFVPLHRNYYITNHGRKNQETEKDKNPP